MKDDMPERETNSTSHEIDNTTLEVTAHYGRKSLLDIFKGMIERDIEKIRAERHTKE